ncbi:putative S-adenosyl-L-methionine-dependent methyltransferase [Rhizoctonia solani 123E]|uniref:Putative S-adenosyl-L-methionine-dependent methyltransferase n=1 Tax=Rhizoctonia solani 123E TaxID=1423351 RepID=A0A074RL19_9AGAM|nr:putative S-adenosyl-L-methionine-dependent methyltransferase [Rhizoctonia solani 123E]
MVIPNAMPEYTWSPTHYNNGADFVYSDAVTQPLFELLSLQSGERVVDMGCGTGELTLRLQKLTGEGGLVWGVDANESMVIICATGTFMLYELTLIYLQLEIAKKNGIETLFCCDLQKFVMPDKFREWTGTFDAVFTNSTLHWCKQDPHGPVKAAKSLLKPGGRFVGEFCGHMSALGIRGAFSQVLKRRGIEPADPWYFPLPADYAKAKSEGFEVEHISLNPRIVPLSGSIIGFLRAIFRIAMLKDMSDEEAEDVLQEVSKICEVDHRDERGTWYMMNVTVRFRAIARHTA